MSEKLIKNVDHAVPFNLGNLVEYSKGKVASLTLSQKPGVGITIFAFDEGEGVNTHCAPGDALAFVLEGEAAITIDGALFQAKAGEGVVMPSGIPHAVKAVTRVKMLLTVVKNV